MKCPQKFKFHCGFECEKCGSIITIATLHSTVYSEGRIFVTGDALVCSECNPETFSELVKNLTASDIPMELFEEYLQFMPLTHNPPPQNPYRVGDEAFYRGLQGEVVALLGDNNKFVLFRIEKDSSLVCVLPVELIKPATE